MKLNIKIIIILIAPIFLAGSKQSFSQRLIDAPSKIKLGAYYFDGWTSPTDFHITNSLVTKFQARKSKWGWVTSSPDIMSQQINLAAKAGLSFFSFCWYYGSEQRYKNDPLNRSLNFYLKASNNNRLQFNLLVANHEGYILGPKDWNNLEGIWIEIFKNSQYFKIDGKPYIIFFSVPTLVQSFGSADAVKQALNDFRNAAITAGLKGVTIGACVSPNAESIKVAEVCGFDILTGYNYHSAGFNSTQQRAVLIDTLLNSDFNTWKFMSKNSSVPFIPVSTLNWDPRPWADSKNHYDTEHYYIGYSAASVYKTVKNLIAWINTYPVTAAEKVGMLYAWNEYGEGAWLTPSKQSGNKLLKSVRLALKENN